MSLTTYSTNATCTSCEVVRRAQAGQYMPQGFDAETEFQIVRSGSSSTIIESKGFLKISGKYH